MSMFKLPYVIVILLCCFQSQSLFAWNALAHMVVANIAYQDLKPQVRDKVDQLVAGMHTEYPDINSFLQIAPWPDSLRGQKIEMFTRWHYIDIAFSTDGTPVKNLVDTDNAVWAINNLQQVVKNNKANQFERVRFLALFTHIVGDIHQPLHTVSYISAALPDGDKGGNSYFIRYHNERMNLHRLWDGGVGVFEGDGSMDRAYVLTSTITSAYPPSYFGKKINDLNPDNWVREGVTNAKQYVYSAPQEKELSSAYVEQGKQLAQQEIALAGYRLGQWLNLLLA